jgi:hypothetical protein
MTTTDLATHALTDQQIQTRIELNKKAGWGLEKGTSPQLNMVFLYCQKHQLLPGDDVTLYEGRPWLTLDGRVKLMRRHPEYRGFSCKPLSKADKEAWGYQTDDIVIECTIRTSTWGEISARGKVSKEEAEGVQIQGRRMSPVARIHPVEMAEKRAISRAERAAFGLDAVLDDDELEASALQVITERNDPERVAAGAAEFDRIFPPDEERAVPTRERDPGDRERSEPTTQSAF